MIGVKTAHRAGESFAYCGGFVFRKAGKRFCFSLPLNEQIDRKRFIHSLSLLFKVYFGVCLSYERRVLSHHSLDFLFDICYNQGAKLIYSKYHLQSPVPAGGFFYSLKARQISGFSSASTHFLGSSFRQQPRLSDASGHS